MAAHSSLDFNLLVALCISSTHPPLQTKYGKRRFYKKENERRVSNSELGSFSKIII